LWTSAGDWTLETPDRCADEVPIGPWLPRPGVVGFVGSKSLVVFDVAKRAVAYEVDRQEREVWGLFSSPTGDSIAVVFLSTAESTTGDAGSLTVELWTPDGDAPARTWRKSPDRIGLGTATYSPDGKSLYVGWRDGTVEVLDSDGRERTLANHTGPVERLRLTADGSLLASTDDDEVTLVLPATDANGGGARSAQRGASSH